MDFEEVKIQNNTLKKSFMKSIITLDEQARSEDMHVPRSLGNYCNILPDAAQQIYRMSKINKQSIYQSDRAI
jgi:hypothetical protein